MDEIQDLLESIMEGHGKFRRYSLDKIRNLDDASKNKIVHYLSGHKLPIPAALHPSMVFSTRFLQDRGYTHSYVENKILMYRI